MRLFLFISCILYSTLLVAGGDPSSATSKDAILMQDNPVLTYQLQSLDQSSGNKFVLVTIAHVTNPDSIPLAFKVYYQKPGEERFYLGGFALFPPGNPGRFIVPTQGKVSQEGEVLLTMDPLENQTTATSVRVQVREVKLTDSLD